MCGQTEWYRWGECVDRLGGIGGESVWTDWVVIGGESVVDRLGGIGGGESVDRLGGIGGASVWTDWVV